MLKDAAAIETAQAIHGDRYSGAAVTFFGGSLARGEGTATSDFDLVVVFEKLDNARRESFSFDGWPVEAFVHDPATLRYFFGRDRDAGVPTGRSPRRGTGTVDTSARRCFSLSAHEPRRRPARAAFRRRADGDNRHVVRRARESLFSEPQPLVGEGQEHPSAAESRRSGGRDALRCGVRIAVWPRRNARCDRLDRGNTTAERRLALRRLCRGRAGSLAQHVIALLPMERAGSCGRAAAQRSSCGE
jgi:hypothetical protein